MTGGPVITRQAHLELDRHGEDVTLKTYTAGSTDDYEDPSWSESTSTIKAFVKLQTGASGGRFVVDAAGRERQIAGEAWVKSTVGVAADPDRAPELTVDGVDYEIVAVDDQEAGFHRLILARMRN